MPLARLEPHTPWPQRPRCLATRQCTSARPCRWRAQRSPRPARRPPWPKCLDSPEGRPVGTRVSCKVQSPKTACSSSTASSLGDTNGVCRRAQALQKAVCQLISSELREAPHLTLLGRAELYAGWALHSHHSMGFAQPEPLGLSRRRAHLGALLVIDHECTRGRGFRPLRRAVFCPGQEQQACGRTVSTQFIR